MELLAHLHTHMSIRKYVSSKPTDTHVASESGSALRESASGVECLKHELETQSQELMLVRKQLHLVQLELDEEKQKCLTQAEKIKELELSVTRE